MEDEDYFENRSKDFLEEFAQFLHFSSVSCDAHYLPNCHECAHFLVDRLRSIFAVELWEEPGHPPIIFASYKSPDPSAQTLLLYNHYDVQPANLSDGWLGDPFTMRRVEERLLARGASDNKGQCFYTWKALEYFYSLHSDFPLNISWVIEGEEESGSSLLKKIAEKKHEQLRADHFLIVDGGFASKESPSVLVGGRGIVTMVLTLEEGSQDMHSGTFGGIAYNVNRALAEALASLHNEDNSIAVEGFYEGMIAPIGSAEDDEPLVFAFTPTLYPPAKTPQEAASLYPTIEINGISGGYTGPGFKTVIPYKAVAYLSCRLIPNQDPQFVFECVSKHVKSRIPDSISCSLEMIDGSQGWRSPNGLRISSLLCGIYEKIYNKPCKEKNMTGSIPVAPLLAKVSGASAVVCGTSYHSDRIHAAEENFSIEQLRNGFLSIVRLLEAFAQ